MKTSNFATHRIAKFPNAISIARTSLTVFDGRQYPALRPTRELLRAYKYDGMLDAEYISIYQGEILSALDPIEVAGKNNSYRCARI